MILTNSGLVMQLSHEIAERAGESRIYFNRLLSYLPKAFNEVGVHYFPPKHHEEHIRRATVLVKTSLGFPGPPSASGPEISALNSVAWEQCADPELNKS